MVGTHHYLIKQGYLASKKGLTLRVRQSCCISGKHIKQILCFKQKTNGRVIEIEKNIDKRDFRDLWKICKSKVYKVRHELVFKTDGIWEVDFFKKVSGKNKSILDGETYFAMAEHEAPEGRIKPDFVPDLISQNSIYVPSQDDDRFSSKKLSNIYYATDLYKELEKDILAVTER